VKKYIVRLSEEECEISKKVVKKLSGSSQKVRRAQILIKANIEGLNWSDKQIAEAFSCRTETVENLRKTLVTQGFEIALNGKKREAPPRKRALDGEQEARVIAVRLGSPPEGFGSWSLRLLKEQVIELEVVESVSHETIRTVLKKRNEQAEDPILGYSSEKEL
jgi:hypothetical protein